MLRKALKVSAVAIAMCTSTVAICGEVTFAEIRLDLLNSMKEAAFYHLRYTLYAEQA